MSYISFDNIALAITAALQAVTANELRKAKNLSQTRDDRNERRRAAKL